MGLVDRRPVVCRNLAMGFWVPLHYAEQDNYTVEKILAQRPKASAPGGLEFKVRWRGYGPSHDTWEPVSSFVPRVNTPFMEYIRKHKTKIHVSDLAALTRAIAARGA